MTGTPPTTAPLPETVLRTLDALDAPWTVVRHCDLDEPVRSAADVARQLGLDPGDITKTLLVTRRPGPGTHALVVVPVDGRMDPVAVAGTLGWEQTALASPEELARTGQTVGGVSPLGTPFVVVMDETLLARPRVLVGAGTPGVEIAIDPRVLLDAVGGIAAPVTGSGARTGAGRADVGGGG